MVRVLTSDERMIEALIRNGFAMELANMLLGEGEYADFEALASLDKHSYRLKGMAARHLEFVAEFGDISESVWKGKLLLSPYPEYYEAWKLAGFPGIGSATLERLHDERAKTL
jgi:hypothetical protein